MSEDYDDVDARLFHLEWAVDRINDIVDELVPVATQMIGAGTIQGPV